MIVCLGWGSLIWDARDLPLAGSWQSDGPELPVEFVRQSKDGHLTLVIDGESPTQRVLWAPLSVATMPEAIRALRIRENTESDLPIGRWPNPRSAHAFVEAIERWTRFRKFDGVVWTALGAKFENERGRRPSQAEAVSYLAGLSGNPRERAEEYVRKAPMQIDTPYRRALVERLGWTPTDQL